MVASSGATDHFVSALERQRRGTSAGSRRGSHHQFIEDQIEREPRRKATGDLSLESLDQIRLDERIPIVRVRIRKRSG
jgi:hypothetical protein